MLLTITNSGTYQVLTFFLLIYIYIFFFFIIYLLNKIQHNSTINFTITGRKKRGKTVKKKKTNKEKIREILKFNRLTTTRRTNRKIIYNGARLLDYYKSTLIRNAQGNSGWSTYFCIC